MAATTSSSYDYSRHAAALSQSPDTASPVFPHRPIRPLPKRRIRSRLSEEQAGSIVFPPVPPSSSPLFGSSAGQLDRNFAHSQYQANVGVVHDQHDHDHVCSCGADHSDFDSDEDEEEKEAFNHRYSWPGRSTRHSRQFVEQVAIRNKAPLHDSSTSSVDGYESFENTNNKKKRKIPISGAIGPILASDSNGMNVSAQSVEASSVLDQEHAIGQYYGTGSMAAPAGSGVGISGAGRGRFGRAAARTLSERRPLATSTNGLNVSAGGLSGSSADHGIISAAIANAAENSPLAPPKGQENISLLQRQSKGYDNPSNNFTFECKSDSSNKIGLSARPINVGGMNPAMGSSDAVPGVSTHGTQTSPKAAGQVNGPAVRQQAAAQNASSAPQPPAPAPKKAKPRRPGQIYAVAAQQRREQKAYENYHHPPRKEDVWICEFCEYESIFGKEPQALIRQYEIKDRKARKASEERRRLLEKAKAKARKNKKSSKNAKNSTQATSQQGSGQSQRYDPQFDSMSPQDVDSQGEEYYDERYDEPGFPEHEEDYQFSSPPPVTEPGLYNPKLTGSVSSPH